MKHSPTLQANQPTVARPWLILMVLSLPVFIGSLDLTIVSAFLPEVINQLKLPLDTRLDDASWAISGYLLAYTISMTFMGRISDLMGRRSVYIICLAIFTFGSWFVAIAHTWPADWYLKIYRWIYPNPDTHIPPPEEIRQLYMIILGRVIQAFGAGAIVPVTMAVVSDMFPAQRRARPLGLVGAIDTSGWVLGHLYGGTMVKFFGAHGGRIVDAFNDLGIHISHPDWRTLFILNIPFSLIALAGAVWALRGPQFRQRYGEGRFDYIGTALITLALIGLSVGLGAASPESAYGAASFEDLSQGGSNQYTGPLLIMAAVAFVAFVFWELRARHPMLNLRLFLRRNYGASAFTNFCVGFTLAIGLVGVPMVINLRADSTESAAFQDAALTVGLVLSGLTVPMALAAFPGGWLSERLGYRDVTVVGMVLSTLGFLLCSMTWSADIESWIMALEVSVIGVGLGLTISPVSTALINEVKIGERGVSAALVLIMRLIGMTVAMSGMTAYALSRVEQRISQLGTFDSVIERQEAYLDVTIEQINELFLIGALVSILAVLVATRLYGGRVGNAEIETQYRRPEAAADVSVPAKA